MNTDFLAIPDWFSFENAGALSLDIPIEIPSERDTERPTVNIQPPHPTPLWEEGHGGEAAGAVGDHAAEVTPEATATTTATG